MPKKETSRSMHGRIQDLLGNRATQNRIGKQKHGIDRLAFGDLPLLEALRLKEKYGQLVSLVSSRGALDFLLGGRTPYSYFFWTAFGKYSKMRN